MLIKKLSKSRNRLDKFIREKEKEDKLNTLEDRKKYLGVFYNNIYEARRIADNVEKKVDGSLKFEEKDKIKANLNNIKKGLEEDRFVDINIPDVSNDLKEMGHRYRSNWEAYFIENYGRTIGLFDVLKTVINDRDLLVIRSGVKKYEKKWPLEKGDVEKLEENKLKAEKKIRQLGLNSEIENFLRKLVQGDATLEDCSPEVLKWMEDNKILNKIGLSV